MTSAAIFDDLELIIQLDRSAEQSLRNQLIEQVGKAILDGRLTPGRQLPSTRSLARLLGISRNVVVGAYDELFVEGYILRKPGSGTCVNTELTLWPRSREHAQVASPRWLRADAQANADSSAGEHASKVSFQLGASDMSPLPLSSWRSIWKHVSTSLPPAASQLASDLELRVAIVEYLRRSRGLVCEADDIIVTASATQAIDIIARALLVDGDRVGFEEPGYFLARQVFLNRGASIVSLPVDLDGVQVGALPEGSQAPLLVYVTPAHQFPLGGRLSLERREKLLAWGAAHDSLIIEDDYDSEFRYEASALPTLISLDRQRRVVYLGTFSKALSPALRLGYLVVPPAVRQRLAQVIWQPIDSPSWPIQQALLVGMREGHLERHIRRMRRIYAKKRAHLSDLLAPISHLVRIHGLEAGLHVYLELDPRIDPRRVVQEAGKRGVILLTLDQFYLGEPQRQGLLLGYGGLTLAEISQGATVLADVILQLAGIARTLG